MEKLKLSTKKCLYPAIEIEIDDTIYQSRKFTEQLLISIKPLEPELTKAEPKWDVLCKWMNIVFGIKKEALDMLARAEVEDIFMKTQEDILSREKKRMEKHMAALETEVGDIKKTADKATDIEKTTEEIGKNISRSGKKK